jgi:hypothetical protein
MSLNRRFTNYKLLIYIPEDHIELVQEYVKSCKATGETASSRIVQFIDEDFKALQNKAKPVTKCERCNKDSASRYVKFVSGKRFWVCDLCYEHCLSHNLVRDVLIEKQESEQFNPNLFGVGKLKPTSKPQPQE